jgi:hypothetical protein
MKPMRTVQPELLDGLREDDPAALRNRRDLRRLNAVMGNHRWLSRQLLAELRPGDRVLELGAGDGLLLRRMAGIATVPGVRFAGLDRASRPQDLPAEVGWIRGDVLEFEAWRECTVIVVNLLLHQFEDAHLQLLGARLRSGPRVLLVNETVRGRWHLFMARVAFLLGMGPVSRHDAVVSVRAGFRPGELGPLLGCAGGSWDTVERVSALSALRFVARRKGEAPH